MRNIFPLPLPSPGKKIHRRYFPLGCVTIQFELPVDDPVNKVRAKCGKKGIVIFVPINFPDIHKMTPLELVKYVQPTGLSSVLTTLNNTVILSKELPV